MATGRFELRTFDLENLSTRTRRSAYPFDDLEVGQGFAVLKRVSSISGRVSAENRKSNKKFISRSDPEASEENPKTWVIRVS
ncbi:MAG: hypothetical protein KDK08_26835 [Rhizobiaceae bacterium]|nr:hypothetical protein [Rhizobiaceae bacterium]